ncbi:MAG: MBL fold metallo-hydrolase [Desulfitobacteriaceae bacterium]
MSEHFVELRDHLYFLPGEQGGRFPYSNGLLVEGERRVLVDSGFGSVLRNEVLSTGDVDVILNTHYHFDHTYGNRYFPKAEIWAHSIDALAIRSLEVFYMFTGFDKLGEIPGKDAFPEGMEQRPVSRELHDNEFIDFGPFQLQVLHTPGHTPGHISLYEPEAGILFAGDIDLSSFGPWYGNIQSNIDDFEVSIQRLIELRPKILVTSHREVMTDQIEERFREYAAKIEQREERILQYLGSGKTMEELLDAKLIFRQHPEPQKLYRFVEQIMLEKHLQRLLRCGKVSVKAERQLKACL